MWQSEEIKDYTEGQLTPSWIKKSENGAFLGTEMRRFSLLQMHEVDGLSDFCTPLQLQQLLLQQNYNKIPFVQQQVQQQQLQNNSK